MKQEVNGGEVPSQNPRTTDGQEPESESKFRESEGVEFHEQINSRLK